MYPSTSREVGRARAVPHQISAVSNSAIGAAVLTGLVCVALAPAGPASAAEAHELAQSLSEGIKIDTWEGAGAEHRGERFIEYLAQRFPAVHKELEVVRVGGRSLLYVWRGGDPSQSPVLWLAHYDVVPVAADTVDEWTHPPFDGVVADGFVWGRGSLDNKNNVVSLMHTLEELVLSGARPTRTLVLGLGHDEETDGRGAAAMAAWLKAQNLSPGLVLDEGLVVGDKLVPGVEDPMAMIGIAEKGYLTLRLVAEGEKTHSAAPIRETAIDRLSEALTKIRRRQLPARIAGDARLFFHGVGRRMPGARGLGVRLATSKSLFWAFKPLLKWQLGRDEVTNAAIRTTMIPTVLDAGDEENTSPGRATALLNFRLLPGDSVDWVMNKVRKRLRRSDVEVEIVGTPSEASAVSSHDSDDYRALKEATQAVYPNAVVLPTLFVAATDSRYFADSNPLTYRYTPILVNQQDLHRFHGIDERISLENLGRLHEFHQRVLADVTDIVRISPAPGDTRLVDMGDGEIPIPTDGLR